MGVGRAPAIPFSGPPARPGWVYLVGGGPGDPGLVGLRAAGLLATATVVAHDRLSPAAALTLCRDACELIDVGKQPDRHPLSQEEINSLLVQRAQAGDAVVRFKGGDPFVLGRGSEEAQACLAAGVPFEVVPAVTAGIAASAYAGIPVTHRGTAPAFAVVTGHEDPTKPDTQVDYAALAAFPGTLLLYMGVGRLAEISAALVAAGRSASTPVALVQWGTTPRQRTVTGTLADIARRREEVGLTNPAIIVVGDVVGLHDELSWFEQRPLHGVSVLVPRTRQQAGELSEHLRGLGAEPVEAPTIAIEPPTDPGAMSRAAAALRDGAYDWVLLTSVNAVQSLWDAVTAAGADARCFAGVRLGAVGAGTAAALQACGLRADVVPERQTGRDLASAVLAAAAAPARALLPRADIATAVLTGALREAGWEAEEVEAYRTVAVPALDAQVERRLRDGEISVVALASSSTARSLHALLGGSWPAGLRVASIGPVTSDTCRELGIRVDAEADPHDVAGLAEAVLAAAGARTG